MVRMYAGRTAKTRGMSPHEVDRSLRARNRTARNHHARDAGGGCMLDDQVTIVIKAVVSEIDADVDEFGRRCAGLCGQTGMLDRYAIVRA
jgi:hypothetical protein